MFTSGTAGAPAGGDAHPRQPAAPTSSRPARCRDRVSADDVVYGVLPLFHIFGLNVVLGLTCSSGRRCCSCSGSTRRPRSSRSATAASPSCPARRRCGWRSPTSTRRPPTPSPRCASPCPAPPSCRSTRRRAAASERFGLVDRRGLRPHRGVAGRDLVGRAAAAVRLGRRACSTASSCGSSTTTARTCSSATPARSGCAAPNVFAGYLDDPEATARVLTADGWLRTGDIGYCDDDGYLYLVDRAKDLIIVSGFNVFPAEVEEVLLGPPRRRRGRRHRRAAPAHRRGGQGVRRRSPPAPTSTRTR